MFLPWKPYPETFHLPNKILKAPQNVAGQDNPAKLNSGLTIRRSEVENGSK
jgi:hypothetical protein